MRITIMITKGSLRKHPFLLALRRALGTSRAAAAKSEEKRMFSRATPKGDQSGVIGSGYRGLRR